MTLPAENNSSRKDIEIENLFDLDKINNELIAPHHEGKTFDPKKEHEDSEHVGKEIFSKEIISNYDSEIIDFSKFKPLLDMIAGLSKDYTKYKQEKE